MDVSIVIVSYNVANRTNDCIVSVKTETTCLYEIIVVDNNSQDNSVEVLRANYPDVRLIQNTYNAGFAKANNQAFREARGRYIFMLNPDTVVLDKAIDRLVQFMDEHLYAGACGPKVLNSDMTLQPNCHHYPSVLMRLIEHSGFNRRFPQNRFFGKEFMTYWNYNEVREIDWITGCAIMLRKRVLDQIGMLDENYFMYTEEVDICYRIKKKGFKIVFCPTAKIIHYWGESSLKEEKDSTGSLNKYLYSTRYYFIRKSYGLIHYLLFKLVDFLFYLVVYLKNLFRRDAIVRKQKLSHANNVLTLILFGK